MSFWTQLDARDAANIASREPALNETTSLASVTLDGRPVQVAKSKMQLPRGADARDHARLTESGNCQRLFRRRGSDIRYIHDKRAWIFWDGSAWRWDDDASQIRRFAVLLYKEIYAEGTSDILGAEYYSAWARKSQSINVIRATVALLADLPALRLTLSEIDADPMLIGFDSAQQVIDLATGAVRAAQREDYITHSLGVTHIGDPTKAVRWTQFLDEVFEGDKDLIAWLSRFIGYSLTGKMDEQCFIFCWGNGSNGKSVFLDILNRLFADYAKTIQPETLMLQTRTGAGATPDLARLAGARFISGNETESGKALAENLVKQLTAGDTIAARELYGKPFEFKPTGKLILAGNHRPVIRGTDGGIWRRIRLIPFTRIFAPHERDPLLMANLVNELPHIVAWAVLSCLEWQKVGLQHMPSAIEGSNAEYREEQDILGQWLAENTCSFPGGRIGASDLYQNYRSWADRNGLHPITAQALGRQLTDRGIGKNRTSAGNCYLGLGLTSG